MGRLAANTPHYSGTTEASTEPTPARVTAARYARQSLMGWCATAAGLTPLTPGDPVPAFCSPSRNSELGGKLEIKDWLSFFRDLVLFLRGLVQVRWNSRVFAVRVGKEPAAAHRQHVQAFSVSLQGFQTLFCA